LFRASAKATGDDHFTILIERFADRVQTLLNGRIDKSTGVHHHQIRRFIIGHNLVPFGAKLRQNIFRIHKGFRATKGDKTNFWGIALHRTLLTSLLKNRALSYYKLKRADKKTPHFITNGALINEG